MYMCIYVCIYIIWVNCKHVCYTPVSSGHQPWLAAWESIKYRHLKRTRVSIAGFDDH